MTPPIDPQLDAALDEPILKLVDAIQEQYRKYETGKRPTDEANDCISDYIAQAKSRLAEIVGERERAARFDELKELQISPNLSDAAKDENYEGYIKHRVAALRPQQKEEE